MPTRARKSEAAEPAAVEEQRQIHVVRLLVMVVRRELLGADAQRVFDGKVRRLLLAAEATLGTLVIALRQRHALVEAGRPRRRIAAPRRRGRRRRSPPPRPARANLSRTRCLARCQHVQAAKDGDRHAKVDPSSAREAEQDREAEDQQEAEHAAAIWRIWLRPAGSGRRRAPAPGTDRTRWGL